MRKFSVLGVFLVLGLFLMGSIALGGDCKKIKANVGTAFYPELADCPATLWPSVEIGGCIDTPIYGNLKGNWVYYWPVVGNFFDEGDLNNDHPGFTIFASFSVFKTKKGALWTRDSTIIDSAHATFLDFFVQTSFIVGGTGIYEGATGQLGYIGNESAGIISGEVCMP